MMQSMTGFATKTITISGDNQEKTHVSISIKTLNSRFFDTTCRLHYSLSSLEHHIIKKAKKMLLRGHAYVTIHVSNPNVFKGSVQPALATVESYMHAIEAIRTTTQIQEKPSLSDVLRLPNIFSTEEEELKQETIDTVLATVDELLAQVVAARTQEGSALQKDIMARIQIMHTEIDAIAQRSQAVIQKHKEKVHDTLREIQADESLLASAQKSALYTMLDKLDLNEELVRFANHLENIKKYSASETVEKGKRLDFTLQELTREINTIAAKCSDADISEHAINIKVEIEKAREQTQNVV